MTANIHDGIVTYVGLNGGSTECPDSVLIGWEYLNGVFSKPLSIGKTEKLQELNQWHDEQITAMKAQYADADVEMFPLKQAEAKAWELNNTAPTPTVDRIAKGDPIKRVEELNAILMKVNAVIDLSSYVGDVRSAIKACTTQEQLDAIVW